MTDKLRQAAEETVKKLEHISRKLEGHRVWGGMKWEYHAILPSQYLPLRDFIDSQIRALRKALDQSPDTTKMIEPSMVCVRYWVQDTMESGRWVKTEPMSKSKAKILLSEAYRSAFPQGEIVELPDTGTDRGA